MGFGGFCFEMLTGLEDPKKTIKNKGKLRQDVAKNVLANAGRLSYGFVKTYQDGQSSRIWPANSGLGKQTQRSSLSRPQFHTWIERVPSGQKAVARRTSRFQPSTDMGNRQVHPMHGSCDCDQCLQPQAVERRPFTNEQLRQSRPEQYYDDKYYATQNQPQRLITDKVSKSKSVPTVLQQNRQQSDYHHWHGQGDEQAIHHHKIMVHDYGMQCYVCEAEYRNVYGTDLPTSKWCMYVGVDDPFCWLCGLKHPKLNDEDFARAGTRIGKKLDRDAEEDEDSEDSEGEKIVSRKARKLHKTLTKNDNEASGGRGGNKNKDRSVEEGK